MRGKKVTFLAAIVVCLALVFSVSEAKVKGPGNAVLENGLSYIYRIQNADGSWPLVEKEGGGDLEATLWATRSIFMSTKPGDPGYILGLKGLSYIVSAQQKDGGFSNNSAHTAFAIMALKSSGQGKSAIQKAVKWLKNVQNEDGGWRTGLKGPSLSIYTAVVLKAFKMIGIPKKDPAVMRAIQWLKDAQNGDGGWGVPKGGKSLSLSTSWALNSLSSYGEKGSADYMKKGYGWLTEAQTGRNGGFVIFPHPATTADPELTAYSILALSHSKAYKARIKRAVAYLADVQRPSGVFVSNTPKEFKKKKKANTQTTCFVIWALKAAGY